VLDLDAFDRGDELGHATMVAAVSLLGKAMETPACNRPVRSAPRRRRTPWSTMKLKGTMP
jgi:hypothetical protein